MGCSKSISKKESFIAIQACLKIYKTLIKNINLYLKEIEKEQQTEPNISRKKEIIKSRAEINEIET